MGGEVGVRPSANLILGLGLLFRLDLLLLWTVPSFVARDLAPAILSQLAASDDRDVRSEPLQQRKANTSRPATSRTLSDGGM